MISTNIKRNFKFDINSTENQGRFRINDPKIFKRMWTRHDPVHKGISYIVGIKQNGEFSTQSIRFNRSIWSEKKAASWWKENKKRFVKYKTPSATQTSKKPLKSRKRKNPQEPQFYTTEEGNYYISNIGQNHDFERALDLFMFFIKKLGINYPIDKFFGIPEIYLISGDNYKNKSKLAFYDEKSNNIVIINQDYYENPHYIFTRTLFHEFGHYYYRKILSPKCYLYFSEYVLKHFKWINLEKLQVLKNKYSISELSEKFPLLVFLLNSLIKKQDLESASDLVEKFGKHYYQYTRPVSGYIPNNEEIFCEIFASYMLEERSDKLKYLKENYLVMENILNGKCDKV